MVDAGVVKWTTLCLGAGEDLSNLALRVLVNLGVDGKENNNNTAC